MAIQDNQEAVEAMRFPQVAVKKGSGEFSGYLTDISAKLILIELGRQGFDLVKRDR